MLNRRVIEFCQTYTNLEVMTPFSFYGIPAGIDDDSHVDAHVGYQ